MIRLISSLFKPILLKRALSFIVIFSLVSPHHALSNNIYQVNERISAFLEKYAEKEYAYRLSADEIDKQIEEYNFSNILLLHGYNIQSYQFHLEGGNDTTKRFLRIDDIEAMNREAYGIIDAVFELDNIADINLALLRLYNEHYFAPEVYDEQPGHLRGPLNVLLKAFETRVFSEPELLRLEKKSRKLQQGANGAVLSWILAGVGAVTYGFFRKRAHPNLALLKPNSARRSRATGQAARTQQTKLTESYDLNNLPEEVDTEAFLRQLGTVGSIDVTRSANTASNTSKNVNMAVKATPRGSFRESVNAFGRSLIYGMPYAIGVGAIGAGANIGRHAYLNAIGENLENTYQNPRAISDKYFTGLAVLNLACQTRDLVFRTSEDRHYTPTELLEITQALNYIYSEFTILKEIAPHFLGKVSLPESVSWNAETQKIEYTIDIEKGSLVESPEWQGVLNGEFNCGSKFEHMESFSGLEASLPEVLYDIIVSWFHIQQIQGLFSQQGEESDES